MLNKKMKLSFLFIRIQTNLYVVHFNKLFDINVCIYAFIMGSSTNFNCWYDLRLFFTPLSTVVSRVNQVKLVSVVLFVCWINCGHHLPYKTILITKKYLYCTEY